MSDQDTFSNHWSLPDVMDTLEPPVDGVSPMITEEPVLLDPWAYEIDIFHDIDLPTGAISSHEQPPQDDPPELPFLDSSLSELINHFPPPEAWNPTGHCDEPHLLQQGDVPHALETMIWNDGDVVPPRQSTANVQDPLTSLELVGNPVAKDIVNSAFEEMDISLFLNEEAVRDEDNLDSLLKDLEPASASPPLPYRNLLSNSQSAFLTASSQVAFDNSNHSTKVRQNNKTKYREIQPKPLPGSDFTMTRKPPSVITDFANEQDTLPPISSSSTISFQEQLAPESHQREQRGTERVNAINQVPSSYLCTFPVSSKVSGRQSAKELSEGPTLKRKRAKKGTKKCLRCFVSKKPCDGEFPCRNCQDVWYRAAARRSCNTITLGDCIDSDICELNIFSSTSLRLLDLSNKEDRGHPHDNQSSYTLFEAVTMLITMVLDSPVEIEIAPLLMRQQTYLLAGDSEGLKISSSRFQRLMPWQPRKSIEEYRQISKHPSVIKELMSVTGLALIFLVFVMHQDNLSPLTKFPKAHIQNLAPAWCTATFNILKKQLRQFRRKDANRMERDVMYPILEALAEAAGFYDETLAPIAEQTCFFYLYKNIAASDSVSDPTAHVKTSLLRHQECMRHIQQEIPQINKHLDAYCSYWLKQLDPDRAVADNSLRVFASALAHLNLTNVIDMSPDYGICEEQQERHVKDIWDKMSRLGLAHLEATGLAQEPGSFRAFIADLVESCMPFQEQDMPHDFSDYIGQRRADHDEEALAREMIVLMDEYPFRYPERASKEELLEQLFEVHKKRFQDAKEEFGVPWAFKLMDFYCSAASDARLREAFRTFLFRGKEE